MKREHAIALHQMLSGKIAATVVITEDLESHVWGIALSPQRGEEEEGNVPSKETILKIVSNIANKSKVSVTTVPRPEGETGLPLRVPYVDLIQTLERSTAVTEDTTDHYQ